MSNMFEVIVRDDVLDLDETSIEQLKETISNELGLLYLTPAIKSSIEELRKIGSIN
jgi:hypothetical protein